MKETCNITEWIDRVAEQFEAAGLHYGHGTDNAGDEAAWLVLHAAGEPLDGSFDGWDRVVDAATAAVIGRLVRARCRTGKPLAYLTGTAYFAGLPFEVNESVLVPRSPIAELVRAGFRPWLRPEAIRHVLDLCTGSGCIGIASALYLGNPCIDLADISQDALDVATRNVARHGLGGRARLYRSDLFADLPRENRYDLIVANPPYVPRDRLARLPREYRREPALGLASGHDGLDAPLAILLDAPRFLCEYGLLVCEVGESERRLAELLPGVPFVWLEFENGGSGVFVLTREELTRAAPLVSAAMENRNHVT